MNTEWIEHRRGFDGELLGWLAPTGDGFVVVDLLGRPRSAEVDWQTGEELLDELGIGYLADPFELRLESGEWLRVRITEVSATEIRVKKEDWGAIGADGTSYSVELPVTDDTLRTRSTRA